MTNIRSNKAHCCLYAHSGAFIALRFKIYFYLPNPTRHPSSPHCRIDVLHEFSNVDYNEFLSFVNGRLAKAYASAHGIEQDAAISEIISKIENTTPVPHGATKVSSDATTSRLTDVRGFTGSHKERFDAATGRGRGLEGRTDKPPAFTTSGISAPRK
ncbi:Tubulin polymerization-promoting protein [Fasciola hepatica]|uniref:Tubulin polymerization-promoting protein n=1 Tax=Fasciola hepatica TaxID=6192 RepID=A0A4E0RWK2_FASHE|nr:Tubulin polymerization-promoting protein [Fasciola hepatica]